MGLRAGIHKAQLLFGAFAVVSLVVLAAVPAWGRDVEGTASVTLDGDVTHIGRSQATGTAEFEGTTGKGKAISGEGTLTLIGHRRDDGTFSATKLKVKFTGVLGGTDIEGRATAEPVKALGVDLGEFTVELKGRGRAHWKSAPSSQGDQPE
jgi:hypothetical protein